MNFDEWIALIRDVAHAQDEIATLHFARALRYAPQTQELHARWQDVRAYAACLDLDAVAHVMAWNGWRLNRADGGAPSRTVTSPDGRTFRLSPARYLAAWADEVPRVTPDPSDTRDYVGISRDWWAAADAGEIYPHEDKAYMCIYSAEHVKHAEKYWAHSRATGAQSVARANIQQRALVQYLRARLWMEP